MKRTVSILMIILMLLALGACAAQKQGTTHGVLYRNGISEEEYRREVEANKGRAVGDYIFFDNLSNMLMALQTGQIDLMVVPEPVAEYVCARNEDCQYVQGKGKRILSMAVRAEDADLQRRLNDAIISLTEDGTIKSLFDECVTALDSDPTPVELPAIEGAETVRVAVTGDLPPLDYVTAEGKPAGFNVALLRAVGERAGISFELVTADSAARLSMLSSKRADVVFWMQKDCRTNQDGSVQEIEEAGEGVSLTEPYIEVPSGKVTLKQ